MTPIAGSVESVVAAITDEADAEIERRSAGRDAAVAAILAEDRPEKGLRSPEGFARVAKAREEARERRAREDRLDARTAIERREQWLREVRAAGAKLAGEHESGPGGPDLLFALAAEAVARIPVDACEVIVPERSAALVDAPWLTRLAERSGKRAVRRGASDGLRVESGCLARSDDGRYAFDNTLEARSKRFESAWRSALTALYAHE